jgi:NMD protein affecting ribosome stability and mRNA decay
MQAFVVFHSFHSYRNGNTQTNIYVCKNEDFANTKLNELHEENKCTECNDGEICRDCEEYGTPDFWIEEVEFNPLEDIMLKFGMAS